MYERRNERKEEILARKTASVYERIFRPHS
jgi:hypothetical protein